MIKIYLIIAAGIAGYILFSQLRIKKLKREVDSLHAANKKKEIQISIYQAAVEAVEQAGPDYDIVDIPWIKEELSNEAKKTANNILAAVRDSVVQDN